MSIVIETSYTTGVTVSGGFKRADGLFYDATDGHFRSPSAIPFVNFVEESSPFQGGFILTISSPIVGQWTDGDYLLYLSASDQSTPVIAKYVVGIQAQLVKSVTPMQQGDPITNRKDGTIGGSFHGMYATTWGERTASGNLVTLIGLGSTNSPAGVLIYTPSIAQATHVVLQ